jgi:hypothetical protein
MMNYAQARVASGKGIGPRPRFVIATIIDDDDFVIALQAVELCDPGRKAFLKCWAFVVRQQKDTQGGAGNRRTLAGIGHWNGSPQSSIAGQGP